MCVCVSVCAFTVFSSLQLVFSDVTELFYASDEWKVCLFHISVLISS